MMGVADALVAAGAAARLSRLVTTDELGEHYIQAPTRTFLRNADAPEWVADGLDCPFCVGYWAGVGVLVSYAAASRHPSLLAAWRLAAGTFALNYVVGHISSRLD